jgi:hypothetical protein
MFTFILNIRAWLNYKRSCNLTKIVLSTMKIEVVCVLMHIIFTHMDRYEVDIKRRVTAVYRSGVFLAVLRRCVYDYMSKSLERGRRRARTEASEWR